MPTYIICGGTKEKREKEINKIYSLVKPEAVMAKDPDFQKIGQDENLNVESIRILESLLFLKPYFSAPKVFLIEPFDNLTFEAQSILAKLLDQIGETVIILSGSNEDFLIEPVSNKGQKITLQKEMEMEFSKGELEDTEKVLKEILKSEPGKRIKLISNIGSREEAERFCQIQIVIWRKKLLEERSKKTLMNLGAIIKTLKYIKANVNYKLAIENLILYFH